MLKKLGADEVIDYHSTDFRKEKQVYDVIFDAVMKINRRSCRHVLASHGVYLSVKSPTKESSKRLEAINAIIKKGKLVSYIDRVFSFEDFREAHKVVYSGHKVGNIVLKIESM